MRLLVSKTFIKFSENYNNEAFIARDKVLNTANAGKDI